MKKLLVSVLIGLTAFGAQAGPHHGGHHGHHSGGNWNWVAPALISGAVVYAATRSQPVIVQQPQPVYQAPYGYHWESVLDANCNCYRSVLVPN